MNTVCRNLVFCSRQNRSEPTPPVSQLLLLIRAIHIGLIKLLKYFIIRSRLISTSSCFSTSATSLCFNEILMFANSTLFHNFVRLRIYCSQSTTTNRTLLLSRKKPSLSAGDHHMNYNSWHLAPNSATPVLSLSARNSTTFPRKHLKVGVRLQGNPVGMLRDRGSVSWKRNWETTRGGWKS